ncbi:DUF1707 domain-containing protein [Streptomyces sp. ITFR-16]|uniref:DUF1707 SHOCT-like domain-containing protein n=1 Tax=Streptomyces sp. ITFR-16 TaxID=3075198 RepID=UPI002889C11E|nr:DUF1707 domain-containing protein [Streptomyces sp. ITFR-16]WNI23165.1 DUF1707 domain-containing protein [Streptomyces sp. ITFR-16]
MTAEPSRSADRMRASDADREAVVEQLREAAAEGRIDLDELDARLSQALTAKTYGELAPLTDDLGPVVSDPGEPLTLQGGIHGAQRKGRWKVPPKIVAYGGMGGVRIDFTQAECRLREIQVEVDAQMSGVQIVVPVGWKADTDALDLGFGGVKDKTVGERLPGTPVLRITGTCGMGGVHIRHPNFRERRRQRKELSR